MTFAAKDQKGNFDLSFRLMTTELGDHPVSTESASRSNSLRRVNIRPVRSLVHASTVALASDSA